MKLGQYIGLAIAVCAILEIISFLITHVLITRFGKGIVASKVVGIVFGAALMLVLLFVTTPVRAQGLVDVAKCKIEANNRLPVGRELRKAEADCYSMLPKRARKVQHADQYDPYVVTEGRYNSESGVGAPYPLARYQNGPSQRAHGALSVQREWDLGAELVKPYRFRPER